MCLGNRTLEELEVIDVNSLWCPCCNDFLDRFPVMFVFTIQTLYFEIYSVLLFNSNADFKTHGVPHFIASNGQGWDIKPGCPTPGQYST